MTNFHHKKEIREILEIIQMTVAQQARAEEQMTAMRQAQGTTDMQLAKTNGQLSEMGTQLVETNAQLAKTNAQLAKTNAQLAKTDAQLAKTDAQLAETNAQLAKTDAQLTRTDIQLTKTDRKLNKIASMYGGMANNLGKQAEEFFYRGFKRNPVVMGIRFDEVDRNVKFHGKEYDIVLYNGNSVLVLSVKHKVHPNDIETFLEKDIPKYKELFPQYKDYKLYAGIASLSVESGIEKMVLEKGVLMLTQSGENPKLLNSKGFEVKVY